MPAAAGGGGGGGGGGGDEGSTAIIWGIAGIFVILGLIWFQFKDHIIMGYFHLKVWELDALSLFTHSANVANLREELLTSRPENMNFQDMVVLGQKVGTYLRIPFTLLLLVLAVVVYTGNSIRQYKNIYSMKSLSQREQGNWPQIKPVVNLDLIKSNINTGPWAMAMTPVQFCKRHNLIDVYRKTRGENMTRQEAKRLDVVLKRGEANKVFALQLGPRWEGVDRLPPYAKALFAVFAARINAETKPAAAILQQLNRSSLDKFNYVGVDQMCKKHLDSKLVKEVVEGHAYVLTVMGAMLIAARLDGVQAAADFLWLKPLDRRLWYMLNTMGRQTPFAEAAGPYAHLLAEREAGRRLIVPMVSCATDALELALKSIIYNPEEDQ